MNSTPIVCRDCVACVSGQRRPKPKPRTRPGGLRTRPGGLRTPRRSRRHRPKPPDAGRRQPWATRLPPTGNRSVFRVHYREAPRRPPGAAGKTYNRPTPLAHAAGTQHRSRGPHRRQRSFDSLRSLRMTKEMAPRAPRCASCTPRRPPRARAPPRPHRTRASAGAASPRSGSPSARRFAGGRDARGPSLSSP